MARRWLVCAAAVGAVIALYGLLGFLAVPRLVQWQVPRIAASQLQRQGTVGEVRFNPFSLRLVADQLTLADADGRSLASIDRVVAQGDWRSPLRRAWSLRELRIDGAQVFVAVDANGSSNIGRLLETLHRRPSAPKEKDEAMPRFVAENVTLTRGRVSIDDHQAGYSEQVAPIELQFTRLSTLPQDVDGHHLTANIASGGRVLWRGKASVNPIRAQGEITLESVRLRPPGAYLRQLMRVVLTDGALNATVPYSLAVNDGRVQAQVANGNVSINGLLAAHPDAKEPFVVLKRLEIAGVSGDLNGRELTVDAIRASGGQFVIRRNFRGEFDLANLAQRQQHSADGDPADTASGDSAGPWKATVKQVQLEQVALHAVDAAVEPPTTWDIDQLAVALVLEAQGSAEGPKAQLRDVNLQAKGLSASSGGAQPVSIDRVTLADGLVDLGSRRVQIGRLSAEGGRIRVLRDARGDVNLIHLTKPAPDSGRKPGSGPDWRAQAHQLMLAGLAVEIEDQALGLHTQLQDVSLRAEELGTDPSHSVPFEAGFRWREGGQFAAKGQALPATQSVTADVQLNGLALPMAQPVLERHLRLKLVAGTLNLAGRIETAKDRAGAPNVRFKGNTEVAGLRLLEADGLPFASWKALSAKGMTASLAGVDIPELTLVGSDASVTIEPDRTINAARLLVRQPAGPVKTAARPNAPASTGSPPSAPSSTPFPVRIGALRIRDSRLKFTDLSLVPQFAATIHHLKGTIVGLSTQRGTRSQIELDGSVDEYGQARIRGALNPFEPRQNTDVNVVFRNIDMVGQSPYSMKFAGYRIAAGKMSLDLRYQVRNSQLAGDNKIVIDQLTLGEKVESPDATKLPVALAINILKDDQGRIDLGLPVSGNLDDPDFDYGALIWKALATLVTRIITAPFRAMAGGGAGDQNLEAIEFDPGSAELLPPEREKLARVAEVLNKRPQFKLSVPAGYAQEADTAALRARAVHQELARRAGLPAAAQASGNPPDLGDSRMQSAVRELYAQRFGGAELDKVRVATQNAPPNTGTPGDSAEQPHHLTVFQQLRRAMRGEPQVADTGGFYGELLKRLEQEQSLPPDVLSQLGQQRAQAVAAALTQAGVAAERVTTAAPAMVAATGQRLVPLKLALDVH